MAASVPPVTVVVPCLNEEAALPELVDRLRAMRRNRQVHEWEFLFVDDGSTDGTFAELLRAARDEPWIEVARHQETLGLGAALRTGFTQAASPVVCTIASDCAYPPERLPELTARVAQGAVVVTASNQCDDGDADVRARPLSRAVAHAYTRLIGRSGSALTCLLRAYNREVIKDIHFRANGFSAVGEILLRVMLAGHDVHEVPMRWEAGRCSESKFTTADAIMAHFHLLTLIALTAGTRHVRHALAGSSS